MRPKIRCGITTGPRGSRRKTRIESSRPFAICCRENFWAKPRLGSAGNCPPATTSDLITRPLSPKEALASMRVAPEFTVDLVAAEPLVMDPVAIDWGADGKLWVAEMNDYPMGIDGKWKPGGCVKFLE